MRERGSVPFKRQPFIKGVAKQETVNKSSVTPGTLTMPPRLTAAIHWRNVYRCCPPVSG